MKKKEIKGMKKEDVVKLVAEKRQALRQFRFDITGSKVRDVRLGRTLRRDVARLLTESSRTA